ncbi:helix-turn-helix domain-containing protein [Streptomyces sp. NPDC001297]|uniref:helix-turn-helix domain-containing protein n=1 Tax=Streptomyces sp. NPDC001297 TaxID=3364559 RepID=UPI00367BAA7C
MIPQGRDVRTEAEVAEALGIPLYTFRRKERATFETRVTRVNPKEGRVRLYDAAQADAYASGRPIPTGPELEAEHPGDLLTDKEAAAVLGVDPSTVRSYAATGYLPAGVEQHGRRWPRRDITARSEQGDQREHPEETGAGRPRSTAERPNRGRAGGTADPRVVELADELARTADASGLTGARVAERYGVSRTTGANILRAARERVAAED